MMDRHPFHKLLPAEQPALQRRARSLTNNEHRAQDLVQETLLKAWAFRDRYQADTNLRAWLFTILRNTFLTDVRRRQREIEDVDGLHAARLFANPVQEHSVALKELAYAVEFLPVTQKAALLLVGVEGFSQEETATISGCAAGTVKSRVSRSRARLIEKFGPDMSGAIASRSSLQRSGLSARQYLTAGGS